MNCSKRVYGGYLGQDDFYFCGYVYFGGREYTPRPFVAKYSVADGGLEWFKTFEDIKGWSYSVLVAGGRVVVTGLWSRGGFITCLDSSGNLLWGYLTPKQLYGLTALGDAILAYGNGQLILLRLDGEVLRSASLEIKNALGEWSSANICYAVYVDGKIYAVGYGTNIVSTRRGLGSFDGYLICLDESLKVLWAVGFGNENISEYPRYLDVVDDSLYMCGFNQVYEEGRVVSEDIALLEFRADGTPIGGEAIRIGGHGYSVALRIRGGSIYLVGSVSGYGAGSSDFAVIELQKGAGNATLWTIGGGEEEWCSGAVFTEGGILMYGLTRTWINKGGKHPSPMIVYWPLGYVGEVKWNKSDWESIKVKSYKDLKASPYRFIASPLSVRLRTSYFKAWAPNTKEHMFKVIRSIPSIAVTEPKGGGLGTAPSPFSISAVLAAAALATLITVYLVVRRCRR